MTAYLVVNRQFFGLGQNQHPVRLGDDGRPAGAPVASGLAGLVLYLRPPFRLS